MTAQALLRQLVRPQDASLTVDLDERTGRLFDGALHHHHAADLPAAIDAVQHSQLALAVPTGVAADLVEGHPRHIAAYDDVDLLPADPSVERQLFREPLDDPPEPGGNGVPAFVHPDAEFGEILHPPRL